MNKTIFSLLFLIFSLVSTAKSDPIWGKTGHRVVAAIAEQYLDSTTKQEIQKLLNNQSLALVSTFADEIKFDKRYDKFKPWHYLNMPLDANYQASSKNPKGDLVVGINYCKQKISNANTSHDDKSFYLKLLIHLIGDMHQPFHLGLKSDRGGNDIEVNWRGKKTNMHSVWDSKMIDDFGMSYSELERNRSLLEPNEITQIQRGDILDWVAQTHQITKLVYHDIENDDNLGSAYSFKYLDVARKQMQIAGIRLAKVLNELFKG